MFSSGSEPLHVGPVDFWKAAVAAGNVDATHRNSKTLQKTVYGIITALLLKHSFVTPGYKDCRRTTPCFSFYTPSVAIVL